MPRSIKSQTQSLNYSEKQRQSANYIADLALGLRNTARRSDMPFLAHLLEMAFYEAFTIAHQEEPDMAAIDSRDPVSETS